MALRKSHTIILVFFDDRDAARAVLRKVRRGRRLGSALVHRSIEDQLVVRNPRPNKPLGAAAGAAVLALPVLLMHSSASYLPYGFLLGAAIGWALAAILDRSVEDRLIVRYRRWVVQGETLLVLNIPSGRVAHVLALLRQAGRGQAAIFTVRPEHIAEPEDEARAKKGSGFDRLAAYAMSLAKNHARSPAGIRAKSLLQRMLRSQQTIELVRRELSEAAQVEPSLVAGAEWLLANFYLIRGECAEVMRNLPKRYYGELPLITDGPDPGTPRVYHAARTLARQTDNRIDHSGLTEFFQAYQEILPMTIGELWAIPLMIRLSLIEDLSRLSLVVHERQHDLERADFWANRLINASKRDPDQLLFILSELARSQPKPSTYFAMRLIGQLNNDPAAFAPLKGWFERKLEVAFPEIADREHERQVNLQMSITNALNSLRQLQKMQWPEVFDAISLVEAILRHDPADIYARTDFVTRDLCRHAIEETARWAKRSQSDVAELAIALAGSARGGPHLAQVGYYLIGAGRREFEKWIGCRPPSAIRCREWIRRWAAPLYLGGIAVLASGITAVLTLLAVRIGVHPFMAVVIGFLSLWPASELAVQVVNTLTTALLPPRRLPKMSFRDGIPETHKTLVVVPMIMTKGSIGGHVDRLEVRYLANPDPQLHFALLADFVDAPEPKMPGDQEILALAKEGIAMLNSRYGENRFFLLCRPRQWSASENCWIGWERKRGKIEELNRFLCEGAVSAPDGFLQVGAAEILTAVRYVITLDADTQLPRDSARSLVETIAHPLNQARLSPDGSRLIGGYGIIQPRVSTSLPSAVSTLFTRLFADPTGTDPYARAISDVYQDLFGKGTFYGKGIYDPRVFHQLLSGRFPEARILSHDLLEGAFVGVGFASDIELFDFFPPNYTAFSKRQHRWIRGDWQIADWILPRIPAARDLWEKNPISVINRWKIMDNLRRSLTPIAALGLLLIGWLWTPAAILVSIAVGLMLAFPTMLNPLAFTFPASLANRFSRLALGSSLARLVFWVALLPHQAIISADAVIRVIYRRLISHRHLLEWQTAQTEHITRSNGLRVVIQLRDHGLNTLLALALLAVLPRAALPAAAPFLSLWCLAPLVAYALNGRRSARRGTRISAEKDELLLHRVARKTWRYFDDFVDAGTNWLPPDNYQESHTARLALRTSPTNIGMWLLSALAAHDFGYLTSDQFLERAEASLATVARLERYQGHLFNWYDLQTLEPLAPRYVSTVDSGNLLASLWTFGQGCKALPQGPFDGRKAARGLLDTIAVLMAIPLPAPARLALGSLHELCRQMPAVAADSWGFWEKAAALVAELQSSLEVIAPADPEIKYWSTQLEGAVSQWTKTMETYLPWVKTLIELPSLELPADVIEIYQRSLIETPSLSSIADGNCALAQLVASLRLETRAFSPSFLDCFRTLCGEYDQAKRQSKETLERLAALLDLLADLGEGMSLRFLYDPGRRLFSTGYNVNEARLDSSYYDLLASEARLTSFVAIARGDVPTEHWPALGRPHGWAGNQPVLLSWNGTMFEYLMPILFNHSYANSLLDQACKSAVASQIAYTRRLGIPWGISESAFSALDYSETYQYQAFGVPGLGLKYGLEQDLVVAPYATVLALATAPAKAVANMRRLMRLGLFSRYGFYEAIDYTCPRRPEEERGVVIHNYMAHHQGMSLIAIVNALQNGIMQTRFHADQRVRAAEPLLFERNPVKPPLAESRGLEGPPPRLLPITTVPAIRHFNTPHTPSPKAHLLSNGALSVMVTAAGGGYCRWHDIDITRWRQDTTGDSWGSYCYIKDLEQDALWATTFHPVKTTGRKYGATFNLDHVEFHRRDFGIETKTEIVVAADDDVEIRRVTLVNRSMQKRLLSLTSYAELALAPHRSDSAHPAYNKMFIQTEALPDRNALLAWRRKRSPEETPLWAGHFLLADLPSMEPVQHETDRRRFLGRGHSLRHPAASTQPLSNTSGTVLDPIFSLRHVVALDPGQKATVAFVTTAADSREGILAILGKYQDPAMVGLVFERAWTHSQLELRRLGIQLDEAQNFQELASHILFPNTRLRPSGEVLRQNILGQSHLWAYGISGDLPILSLVVEQGEETVLAREIVLAHDYLAGKGLKMDLVILCKEPTIYSQSILEELRRIVRSFALRTCSDQPGGVFLRAAGQIKEEDRALLLAASSVVLIAARGSLERQLGALLECDDLPPLLKAVRRPTEASAERLPSLDLIYQNGRGGFTPDGREYCLDVNGEETTAKPWSNIMANSRFGTLLTEAGAGFTWHGNSQTNRLTPWSNDAVADPATEAIYLRDEETGALWTPTPQPIREKETYRIRHGQGYSSFEHISQDIRQELTVFVPVDDQGGESIRCQRLRLRNLSDRRRRLTATAYAQWVLGVDPEQTQLHIVSKWDPDNHALLAYNAYNPDFGSQVAFAALSPPADSYTADRMEFLGRNGSPALPAALSRQSLSGRVEAGADPCAAMQTTVEIDPGEEVEITFLLGQCTEIEQVRALLQKYQDPRQVEAALQATRAWWDRTLSAVQVSTPDPAADLLLNRWLLYQTLSCRLWARSAFYQSSGAYGFRDQLQDSLALVHAAPEIAREHILKAASRQFTEGDVQHWWQPPAGGGTRTLISDDLLWLPYVTALYVRATGDTGLLDQRVPFLGGRRLAEHEQESYFTPTPSSMDDGSIFEHCVRALKKGINLGPRGLPLIGSGDWNDGLNHVGPAGRGESIWLAWFLIEVLRDFASLCGQRGEEALAQSYLNLIPELTRAVDKAGWDGEWYRRAYYDDGRPLGSASNDEASIDSVAQSWAAIAGTGEPARLRQALAAVDSRLIRWEDGLVPLLAPPFDRSAQEPGYIKGYPPGIRENGGQYTHAAVWLAEAFARQGQADKAVAVLDLLNPILRTATPEGLARYQGEPYVVAADVYTDLEHEGQSGWTWYTGASAWMYRVWLEEILGCKRYAGALVIDPVIPAAWPEFSISYRYRSATYEIKVENPDGVNRGVIWVELDGARLSDRSVPLMDDGLPHTILARLGLLTDLT